jgi:hypothetical protein
MSYEPTLYIYPNHNCTTSNSLELIALTSIYRSMGGDYWTLKGNWLNMSMSVCSWGGIQCDYNCNVVSIYIVHNNVTGSFPKEIVNLTKLSNVYMMCNFITGGLKNFIGLNKIYEFNLRSNGIFESMIDPNNFPLVFNFVLSYNYIIGTVPDINLPGLGNLELSYNNLTGPMPNIYNSTNYLTVQLNNNNFYGTIPTFNIGKLSYLDLSNNQLSGTIPKEIFTNDQLYYLGLNNNNLSGQIPIHWQFLGKLTYVYLNNNMLSGTLSWPSDSIRSDRYEFIDISNNQLSGQVIIPYVTINFLILSNNKFDGDIINDGIVYYIDIRGNNEMITKKYLNGLLIPIELYAIYENLLCNYVKTNIPYRNFETIILSDPTYYNYVFCQAFTMFDNKLYN